MKTTKTGKRKKGEINVLYNPFALQVTGVTGNRFKKSLGYITLEFMDWMEIPNIHYFQLSKPFTNELF